MAKREILRVRAVEGQMVVHPGSVGKGSIVVLGHESYFDEKDPRFPFGKPVPSQKFRFQGEALAESVVVETGDGYFAAKIREGSLDYVETHDAIDAAPGSGTVDPTLARITAENRKARAAAVAKTPPGVADASVSLPSGESATPTGTAPPGTPEAPPSGRAAKSRG